MADAQVQANILPKTEAEDIWRVRAYPEGGGGDGLSGGWGRSESRATIEERNSLNLLLLSPRRAREREEHEMEQGQVKGGGRRVGSGGRRGAKEGGSVGVEAEEGVGEVGVRAEEGGVETVEGGGEVAVRWEESWQSSEGRRYSRTTRQNPL